MENAQKKPKSSKNDRAPSHPETIDRRRAPETAARILDAAEKLFSLRGYHGVSLRDIATEAGVQVALTHYHFKSKEALFSAVVTRRAGEHADNLLQSLTDAAAQKGSRALRRHAVIRGFIQPVVEKSVRGGAGWKNYIRLMAHVANLPQEQEIVRAFHDHFDIVISRYVAVLSELYPEISSENIQWGFYFYQAATTHIFVESGLLERQSDLHLQSRDLDTVVEKLVPFISAGFLGLK